MWRGAGLDTIPRYDTSILSRSKRTEVRVQSSREFDVSVLHNVDFFQPPTPSLGRKLIGVT